MRASILLFWVLFAQANSFAGSSRSDTLVLITHASHRYDVDAVSEPGVAAILRAGNQEKAQIVSLESGEEDELKFRSLPTHRVMASSKSGEFIFSFRQRHVVLVGGYFEDCMQDTIRSVFQNWTALDEASPVTLTLFAEGIYSWPKSSARTRAILGENPPKQTLAEVFRKLGDDSLRLTQVENSFQQYDTLEYLRENDRLVLAINGRPMREIQKGRRGFLDITINIVTSAKPGREVFTSCNSRLL